MSNFYAEYHGHKLEHLESVVAYYRGVKAAGEIDGIIYLAGDSSLDNKFWFNDKAPATNGYENILNPPVSKKDIAYWLNLKEQERADTVGARVCTDTHDGRRYAVINCAIEESCVGDRSRGRLLPQDAFIRDHITADDVLVVSVGGNDIALKPSPATILNILTLVKCVPFYCLDKCVCGTALPCDDYACGATTGCLSNCLAFPCGIGYFVHLFRTRVEAYLANVLSVPSCWRWPLGLAGGHPPRARKVVACTIYYPDELNTGGWADGTLGALGYSQDPHKLQSLIRTIYSEASSRIVLPGIQVEAVPLFAALDGKDTAQYCSRVEPSALGGESMAELIGRAVHDPSGTGEAMKNSFAEHVATDAARRKAAAMAMAVAHEEPWGSGGLGSPTSPSPLPPDPSESSPLKSDGGALGHGQGSSSRMER